MPRASSAPKQRKVSIWLAVRKPKIKAMEGVDILKDLCGVKYYDLDSQELAAVDNTFPKRPVAEIIGMLSYSSTFVGAASEAAAKIKVKEVYWALAQYDFVYRPNPRRKAVPMAPLFLGVFHWNDGEDDLEVEAE